MGAEKLFGWHLAGSTSAATVLLAVARSAPTATTPPPLEPSTVSPAPQPHGHAGDRGAGDPRPR
jgi:hypothetical protein